MRINQLLMTGLLCGTVIFGGAAIAQTVPVTEGPDAGVVVVDVQDNQRLEAERFLEHVNDARIAMALKDGPLAAQHINAARASLTALRGVKIKHFTKLPSGRVVYDYDVQVGTPHYYPLQTGPMELKTVKQGPFWRATKGIAVTDAQIVYLTVDVSGTKPTERLDAASAQITEGNYAAAGTELSKLVREVVTEDQASSIPLQKARDNLMLARNFIVAGNYDGARYALHYAKKALNEMKHNPQYATKHERIAGLNSEMEKLQAQIKTNDPTLADKASAQIRQWWQELKSWTS